MYINYILIKGKEVYKKTIECDLNIKNGPN